MSIKEFKFGIGFHEVSRRVRLKITASIFITGGFFGAELPSH